MNYALVIKNHEAVWRIASKTIFLCGVLKAVLRNAYSNQKYVAEKWTVWKPNSNWMSEIHTKYSSWDSDNFLCLLIAWKIPIFSLFTWQIILVACMYSESLKSELDWISDTQQLFGFQTVRISDNLWVLLHTVYILFRYCGMARLKSELYY